MKYPRKVLILNTYPRIRLVILEQNIVPGLVLFDNAVLEEKRIRFIIDDDMPEICGTGKHDLCLARLVF